MGSETLFFGMGDDPSIRVARLFSLDLERNLWIKGF
jgi:hypothetical protein